MNGWKRVFGFIGILAGLTARLSAVTPDFKEVYDLLKTNLAGMDDAKLNQAAVQGLLKQLAPQVSIVSEESPSGSTNMPSLIKAVVLEGAYGYFRVGQVTAGLDKTLAEAYQALAATNRLKGLAIDLRFADGQDYAAAAATADLFFAAEKPLLDWGEGMKKGTAKENALRQPVAVLVNSRTAAAAEALAGVLRQAGIGLVLGSQTGGQASKFNEFALSNGQHLRIATAPIKLGDGQALPLTGLTPDIQLAVRLEDERAYFADAYKVLSNSGRVASASGTTANEMSGAGTNRPAHRLNEAELVRMHREGILPDQETNMAFRPLESALVALQDPVLVRALDLLKGLAVVQPQRAN